jgi:radical SAM superfamily enzyme YgiQ (UPF0313 family)
MTAAFVSRGCPYSCSFCAAPLSSGKAVRHLSSARITEEIVECGLAGFTDIIFYDDCLFIRSPKLEDKVLQFSEAVKTARWNGRFQLELRCDAVLALSDRAISALVEAGCRQINMGIEKAQTGQLQRLRKRLSPEVAREACQRIASTSMRAAATFILGGPGETNEDLDLTVDFALSLPLDFAHFNPLALYPGTTLFEEQFGPTASADWLSTCLDLGLAPLGDILWRSHDLPLDTITDAIAGAYRRFYSPPRLNRLLAKLPKGEHIAVALAYEVLATERARSWVGRNGTDSSSIEEGAPVAC